MKPYLLLLDQMPPLEGYQRMDTYELPQRRMSPLFFSKYWLHHRPSQPARPTTDSPQPDTKEEPQTSKQPDSNEQDINENYDAFEYAEFMQNFLQAHPEVTEDQQRACRFWPPGDVNEPDLY